MGLTNPDVSLVDSNGNFVGVSSSMALPVGALGQLLATVNPNTQIIEYLQSVSGVLQTSANVTFPSELFIANFPAVQAVSGTVSLGNWPATIGVSSSFPLRTWDAGVQGVSASFPFSVFNAGTVGISGTVSVVQPVQIWNEGPTAISGAIHTGSTANGFPVVIGGVYYGSGNVGSLPAYVQSLQVDPSGSLYVTTSGSLPVTFAGTVTVGGTVAVSNFPVNQQVWIAGTQGVSGTVGAVIDNWPATFGVSSSFPLQIWSEGPMGVTASNGPLPVWNPATVGVSGSVAVTTVFGTTLTVSGSIVVSKSSNATITRVAASTVNQVALASNSSRVGATFFNEGSSTCFLKFGATASQVSYTVQIASKGFYELSFTYTGEIDAVFNTNTGALQITELT